MKAKQSPKDKKRRKTKKKAFLNCVASKDLPLEKFIRIIDKNDWTTWPGKENVRPMRDKHVVGTRSRSNQMISETPVHDWSKGEKSPAGNLCAYR